MNYIRKLKKKMNKYENNDIHLSSNKFKKLKNKLHTYEKVSCLRKIKYKNKENAIKKASSITSKINEEIIDYYCVFCNNYHIGHSKAK